MWFLTVCTLTNSVSTISVVETPGGESPRTSRSRASQVGSQARGPGSEVCGQFVDQACGTRTSPRGPPDRFDQVGEAAFFGDEAGAAGLAHGRGSRRSRSR